MEKFATPPDFLHLDTKSLGVRQNFENLLEFFANIYLKVIILKRSVFGRVGSKARKPVILSKTYQKFQWKHSIFRKFS